MLRRIWKVVEVKTRKVRVAETERQREEGRRRKEMRNKRRKEKDGDIKSSRRIETLR